MKLEDFNYELDESFIAQSPIKNRDESKLLVLNKEDGRIEHRTFKDIIDYLNKDDILVLNDTKVLPARLIGEKENTKALIEILLLKNIENNIWECLVKPAKRIKVGTIINFSNLLKAKCVDIKDEGIRIFEFIYDGIFYEILDILGTMPLPPYIHNKLEDKDRYQTIYAKNIGSSAAPTAGLHFTIDLINRLKEKGIKICFITLHVGIGTFRPVSVDNIENHKMHSEYYSIDKDTADLLNNKKGRIISVGTTTTRTLETILKNNNKFIECSGWTDIFIYPGYKFKAVDALITNFHLPKSTLLMLVSAFSSKEFIFNSYEEAKKNKYRFFSFGDAMFIK